VSEPDAVATAARDARARQRTWVPGGALLVLSALVGFVARFDLAEFRFLMDAAWAAGVLLLVIGMGRAGSITGRRPFASIVVILQVLIASPPVPTFLSGLIPRNTGNLYAEEDAGTAIMFPYFAAVGVLTIAAVILIGLARALPRPWNWAPAGVLVASAVSSAVMMPLFGLVGIGAVVGRVLYEVPGAGVLFLGVLAIVLGARAGRESMASAPLTTL